MTVVEILESGRARIEKGWCRNVYVWPGDPPRFCAYGALLGSIEAVRADRYTRQHPEASEVLLAALREIAGDCLIFDWNDDLMRTQADVLALYDRAIAKAKESEGPEGER